MGFVYAGVTTQRRGGEAGMVGASDGPVTIGGSSRPGDVRGLALHIIMATSRPALLAVCCKGYGVFKARNPLSSLPSSHTHATHAALT